MLELSECVPGVPVKSRFGGDTGIIISHPFKYLGEIDTVSIVMSDGCLLRHANLEAFSVYRGKNHDTNR